MTDIAACMYAWYITLHGRSTAASLPVFVHLQPSNTDTNQVLTLSTPGTYWFTSQQGNDCAQGGS
jgi:hypothetical protein